MYEIKWIGSPFFKSRSGTKPCAIVNHVSQGTLGSMDAWFNDTKRPQGSSSHFGVGLDGSIHQYVRIEDRAWTQGIPLPSGLSIATAQIVKDMKIDPNRFCVSIEREGFHVVEEGKPDVGKIGWLDGSEIPEAQLKAILWLHRYIKEYIDNTFGGNMPLNAYNVLGHFQIDPHRKPFCPGINFDWKKLRDELAIAQNMTLKLYEMRLSARAERMERLNRAFLVTKRFIDLYNKSKDPTFKYTEQALDKCDLVAEFMRDHDILNPIDMANIEG